jgi:formyl-CoA transferase
MTEQVLPLDGIVVLDFTQVMLGPCATQVLGDFGADVIKIEKPGSGDLSRTSFRADGGEHDPIFWSLNRNKRSVVLDTRSEEGKAAVLALARRADVVVSNFRPGVMDRMGFGYQALSELNPRLIWAQGTGFGDSGPYRHKGGQDILAQAYTGVMYRRPDPDDEFKIYATTLGDFSAGMHLVQGVLLALLARERTGRGQKVEVSLYDSMLSAQMQEACMQLNRGFEVNWGAMPLSGVFPTTDGAVCMVGAFKSNPLQDISIALELDEDLSQRPEFATLELQMKARRELQQIFRERFATNTTAYWMDRLEGQDLLSAPVKSLAEALQDEQTTANGMIIDIGTDARGNTMRAMGSPVHLSDTPARVRHRPPKLGEHTDEVLAALVGDGHPDRESSSTAAVTA